MISQATPWILKGQLNPEARCRLFCLPHSGSGASQFSSWQKFFPDILEVCPIQLPGRESRLREAPLTQIQRMAEILASELKQYLDRPYILYGYSLGALIAFELARQLRRQKVALPICLYALARPAPHLAQTKHPLHQLPDDTFLVELCRQFDGMSPAILQDKELMNLLLPILRADVTALETYVYQAEDPLQCSIRAFGGSSDTTTTEEEMRGWKQHTLGSFEMRIFPGDHFFIRTNQQSIIDSIAAQIP